MGGQTSHGERATDRIVLAIGFMVSANLIFGLINVMAKWMAETYPVIEIVFFRNLFALPPIIWLMVRQGGFRPLRYANWGSHAVRGVLGFGHLTLLFLSFTLMPLADATAISFAAPLILTALSVPLLSEKVGPWRWGAVIAGFIGVLITASPSGDFGYVGALAGVGSATCFALAMITVRRMSATESSAAITFTYTAIMTVLAGLATIPFWMVPAWSHLGVFLGAGLIGGIGQYFIARAYALAPASATAPFTYTTMIWAVLFGFLIWSEVPTVHLAIGCCIVIASGLVILWRENRRRSAAAVA
jgi:drug/metabolite transporter (DMT)-like permease